MENTPSGLSDLMPPELSLWVAVKRHWLAAALTTATVFGAMAFKTLTEQGIYRSQSLIVVANRSSVPLVQDTASRELVENLPTEIEILQSQPLLNRAIAKLPPAYRSIAPWQLERQLNLRQPEDTSVLAIYYEDTDGVRAKAILDALVATYVEYSEETRRSPVTNAIQFIEQRLPALRTKLQKSSDALTEFRTQYNLDNPDDSVRLAYTQKEELQQAIGTTEIELNQLQNTYAALRRQMTELGNNPDTSLSEVAISQDGTYQYLLEQLRELEVKYELDLKRYTPNHPLMKELKERRDELRKLLEEEKQRNPTLTGQGIPARIESGAIEQNLANQLLATRLSILGQEKRLSGLRQQSMEANQALQEFLGLQQQYKELVRQYNLDAQTLDQFLGQLQELRIQEAQDTFTWKVIEPPNLPTVPEARSRIRGLVLGFITGALAGIGMAFFLEKIDPRLREVGDVKKITALPILGVIPQAQSATSLMSSAAGRKSDSFTEAIRSLSLAFSSRNVPLNAKTIAITSATAREGKTTITYNLGLALSELGKRVLVVDADFAHPRLHEVFALDNSQGLTSAIAFDRPWQDLIQSLPPQAPHRGSEAMSQTTALPDLAAVSSQNSPLSSAVFARVSPAAALIENEFPAGESIYRLPDVLTTGPVSNDSFSWLVSPKMERLLQEWRNFYDYVLIDTSEMLSLADTKSLIPKMDEVVLAIGLNRLERGQFTAMLDLLKPNSDKIAGIVVNTTGQGKSDRAEAYTPFS